MDFQRLKKAVTRPWTRARVAGLAYRFGFWRANLWVSTNSATLSDRVWRAVVLKNAGEASAAGLLLDGTLLELPSSRAFWGLMNPALDVLISLGRYRDALKLEPAKAAPRDFQWAMAQSNLAEAEYCQGLWQQAKDRLSQPGLDAAAASQSTARSMLGLQRAWVAVQQADAPTALAQVGASSPADCSRTYRAEWHFTSAAAHSLAGHHRQADDALAAGRRIALRSSSVRNALALRGFLMRARGEPRAAEKWFARAAAHRWRGQGGGALLAWGDVLIELGRSAEARAAWKRAVVQDPQSEAAVIAAQR